MGTESLYVNGFNSVNEQWTEVGAAPWLNDNTSNNINTKNDEDYHEEFTFSDHVGSETLNSATLYMEVQGNSGRNDYVVVDIYDGSSWSNIVELDPDNDSYQWFNYDVSTVLDSWIKVNSAKLRVQYQRSGSPATQTIYVRRAYIYVDYSAAETQVLIQDSVSVSDSIKKERRLSVSDTVAASDGFPKTDKTLSLGDVVNLVEEILKHRTIQPISDVVELTDSILKKREVSLIQDSVGLTESIIRDKPGLSVSDSVQLDDSVSLLKNLFLLDSVGLSDSVSVNYGATQVYVYDSIQLSDSVLKKRLVSVQDSLTLSESLYKKRNLSPVQDSMTLLDHILTDKPVILIGDSVALLDGVRADKDFTVKDYVSLVESIVKEIWGEGWSGKIIGVSDPSKVMGILREKIKDIMNVGT